MAIDPRPCRGDPTFDLVDWALDGVSDDAGARRRVARLAAEVPGVDPCRLSSWCRATATLLAAGVLRSRPDDPRGQLLLGLGGDVP